MEDPIDTVESSAENGENNTIPEESVKRCKIDEHLAVIAEASNSEDTGNASSSAGETSRSSIVQRIEESSESENDVTFNSSHDDYDLNEMSSLSSPSSIKSSLSKSFERIKPNVLLIPKPKHNWFMVPELVNRQFGMKANKQSSVLFQTRCYGSLHCVQRLELMYKLEKHTSCVNSLNFHPNGTLLASGSDDLNVVIWDWKLGKSLLTFDSKHKSNVFQTKFLPLSGDLHIVTCARDGHVRLAQVSAQEGHRGGRKLGSHHGPAHKLAVLNDQPQVIISVGEDGLVLRHDLRHNKAERLHTVQRDGIEVALYSISANPLNTFEYCVAGRDAFVRTYDQRFPSNMLSSYIPNWKWSENLNLHVTCAVYNHNGSEILASYNDENIYLFDVHEKPGNYIHHYEGHRNGATVKGVNFFGPKSEFIVSGSDCGYLYFWEKQSQAIVQFLHADDNGIVNCLEPHPQIPFICTSGLDSDIKVWVPSYEDDPVFDDLDDNVRVNLSARIEWPLEEWHAPIGVYNSQFLWLLWRQMSRNAEHLGVNLSVDDSSNPHTDTSSSSTSSLNVDSDSEDAGDESGGPNDCAFA